MTITAPESEINGSQYENRPPGSKPHRRPSHMWYMVVSDREGEETETLRKLGYNERRTMERKGGGEGGRGDI